MSRHFVTSSAPVHAGITWQERYGCYHTILAGWLEMGFSYESGSGYKVQVAGRTAKLRGQTPEEAARIAVRLAMALILKADREIKELDISSPLWQDGSKEEKK